MEALIPLTDWQKSFLEDESQFRFLAASRQSGKSFAQAVDSVMASVARPRNLDVILSRGERQSLEVMEKVKVVCQALGAAFESVDDFFEETYLNQHTVKFPNGSRVIGLPANPDTARGYTGNLKLDEFGVHRDSKAIWEAAAPIATRGFRITVASTYKGTDNKFYQIGKDLGLHDGIPPATQPVRARGWSGHWVNIHMAAEQNYRALGLRIDVDALREAIGDDEVWNQEYELIPMSSAEQYIPEELVLGCEDDKIAKLEFDWQPRMGLCAGWDFARKRDRSVIFLGIEVLGIVVVVGVIYLDRQTFDEQEKTGVRVAELVRDCNGVFCMDAGGNGAQIAEKLQKNFTCVNAVQFSQVVPTGAVDEKKQEIKELVKLRMARDAKRRFEDRTFRIPDSLKIRRAIASIKRTVSPSGNIIIDAARTEQGHGDEFWALSLLNAALSGTTGYVPLDDGMVGGKTVAGRLRRKVF